MTLKMVVLKPTVSPSVAITVSVKAGAWRNRRMVCDSSDAMRGILQFDRSGILLIQQDFDRPDCPQMGTAVHAGATLGRVGQSVLPPVSFFNNPLISHAPRRPGRSGGGYEKDNL